MDPKISVADRLGLNQTHCKVKRVEKINLDCQHHARET